MSSFAGYEFFIQPKDGYLNPGIQDSQSGVHVWRGRVTIKTQENFDALKGMFSTVDVKRPLNFTYAIVQTKGGPGADTLIVSGSGQGEGTEITYENAVLTDFNPDYDGWREGRMVVQLEFTMP